MPTPVEPLKPEPKTLDDLYGVMQTAITKLEVLVDGEARRDAMYLEHRAAIDERLARIDQVAKRLGGEWAKLFTARAFAWAAPQPARLLAMGLGAFLGAAVVTWMVHHYGAPTLVYVAQH